MEKFMQKINRDVRLFVDGETLRVSRVEDRVAYDQYNRVIPREYLRYQLDVYDCDWQNPHVEVREIVES